MARIKLAEWKENEGIETAEALQERLAELVVDSTCPALCDEGCEVEPDGTCPHDCPSVLLAMGLI